MLVLALEFSRDSAARRRGRNSVHRQPQKPSRKAAGTTARPGHARGEWSPGCGVPTQHDRKRRDTRSSHGLKKLVTRFARAQHSAKGDVTGEDPKRVAP